MDSLYDVGKLSVDYIEGKLIRDIIPTYMRKGMFNYANNIILILE